MKKLFNWLPMHPILFTGLFIVSCGWGYVIFKAATYKSKPHQNNPIIDLPEEYKAISKDSLHPDILTGYYRNDTLFIQFKH